jgi:hypothetical protein
MVSYHITTRGHNPEDRDVSTNKKTIRCFSTIEITRGPFENFVDSPYCSETELCGGAVTVSFSKYTLHPLLENVLQTVDHFEISYLGAPSSWLENP